jgi:hypothetical protein
MDQKKKSLSEISHLFLSSVRDNATGGVRPRRVPPGGERVAPRPAVPPVSPMAMSIDLTPEEYARVIAEGESSDRSTERAPVGPVVALICSQFNGQQAERARDYARHLCGQGERIGLIQLDNNECSVTCFETTKADSTSLDEPAVASGPRQMSEALEELAWDIDRWILLLPSPRTAEARGILRKVNHWVLLGTCDHDGVVSSYRALKGLAQEPHPRLTLALLNAPDKIEAGAVYRKIAGVCEQFLNWQMEAEPAVEPVDLVSENLTLVFNPAKDRAELAVGPQWDVISDFLSLADVQTSEPAPKAAPMKYQSIEPSPTIEPAPILDTKPDVQAPPAMVARPAVAPAPMSNALTDSNEVADLPGGELTESAVLAAVMSKPGLGLIECPIRPPACPQAALAVGRDRRLILLAVARKGLTELRAIAIAYRWVIENRPLLSMAMPQFAIDAHAHPSLKLLIDRGDSGADLLLPMSENGNVTVQTYRKLHWSGKTGLLLEAA